MEDWPLNDWQNGAVLTLAFVAVVWAIMVFYVSRSEKRIGEKLREAKEENKTAHGEITRNVKDGFEKVSQKLDKVSTEIAEIKVDVSRLEGRLEGAGVRPRTPDANA